MKDIQVSMHNFNDVCQELQAEIEENKVVLLSTQAANTGKWGMARLWRKWMAETADFMAGRGVVMPLMITGDGKYYGQRKFNSDDAHELFTRQHLGVSAEGERLSWGRNKAVNGERPATKGERFNALRKHEIWCTEKGLTLFVPRHSEYFELQEQQAA